MAIFAYLYMNLLHLTHIGLTKKVFKKLVLLSMLVLSAHANALVVLQQASVALGVDYDTNPTLSSNDEESVWRYYTTPRYIVSAVQDQNRWYLDGSLRVVRSSNTDLVVDREDPSVNLGWTRDYDLGSFGLIARYNRISTRLTEFDGTGLVAKDGSSRSKSISATWAHALTERLNLNAGSEYLKTDYSGGGLTNYTNKSFNTGLSYQLTETVSPYFNASFSNFRTDGLNSGSTKSQNYMAGANFTLSPVWTAVLGAGVNHVSSVGNGRIFNASSTYLGERYRVTGALARSVSASGIGNFQASDSMRLGYSYDLSEVSKVGTDFSWRKNKSLNDSETKSLSGYYSRELTEYWQMRLTAEAKELQSANRNSNGNIFGISFVYNTPEF